MKISIAASLGLFPLSGTVLVVVAGLGFTSGRVTPDPGDVATLQIRASRQMAARAGYAPASSAIARLAECLAPEEALAGNGHAQFRAEARFPYSGSAVRTPTPMPPIRLRFTAPLARRL